MGAASFVKDSQYFSSLLIKDAFCLCFGMNAIPMLK